MAAEVTGFIGQEQVELNNAATESTLRLLLQSSVATTKAQKEAIAAIAASAGLNPAVVERAEESVAGLGNNSGQLNAGFTRLNENSRQISNIFRSISDSTGDLIDGTESFSKLLSTMARELPNGISQVVSGLSMLAQFQETNLKTYRSISESGVNFSGSLTDMRMAASRAYLTLDEFSNFIKNNGAALASLGDNTNVSTQQFLKFSKALISSDVGNQLLNMGYSYEQINQRSLDYLQATGGRTKGQMEETAKLTEGTLAYMAELDKLSRLTGKSREKISQEIKELSLNPAWQAFLSDPKNKESRDALNYGLMEASRLGKSAAQNFQAAAIGTGVWSKETAAMAGMLPQTYQYFRQIGEVARTEKDAVVARTKISELGSKAMWAAVSQGNAYGLEQLTAMLSRGNADQKAAAEVMLNAITLANERGITSAQQQIDFDNKAAAVSFELTKSQVNDANLVSKAMKDLGTAILANLIGPITFLTPILKTLAENFTLVVGSLIAAGALLATYMTYLKQSGGSMGGGAAGGLSTLFGTRGHWPNKPLYVQVVGGSIPGVTPPEGAGGGGAGGKFNWKGFLKGTAVVAAVTTAMQIPGLISKRGEYDDAVKSGKMSADEAAKAKGGDIGGLAGGALLGIGATLAAGALLAPFTAGMSVPAAFALTGGVGLVAGGVGMAAGDSLGKSIGSSVSGASSEPSAQEEIAKERETRIAATSASSSEKMVLLLAEIRDVMSEHRDITKGIKAYQATDPLSGSKSWQFRGSDRAAAN